MKKRCISITFVALLGIALLFAGSACAAVDFPADEAGISAYVKAMDSVNLNNAKGAFATIERETLDYIIGTVALSLHTEEQYPHVYVSTDGWVVAYYPKNRPSSWLFPWYSYSGGAITTTTLADAVDIVVNQIGGSSSGLKYYNFKFSNATKMMMIAESVTDGADFFKVTVPTTFTPHEAAWSHYAATIRYGGSTYAKLDGVQFNGFGQCNNRVSYGIFGLGSEFKKGVEHQIDLSANVGSYSGNRARVGLVLLYED